MTEKLKKFGMSVVGVFGILLVGLIFAANLIVTSTVSYDGGEVVSYVHDFKWLIFLPVIFILLFLYEKLFARFDSRLIYLIFSAVYLAVGLVLIFTTDYFIRNDAWSVWHSAEGFLSGDYSWFYKDGYIGQFPFQLGMVTYDVIMRLLSSSERILYLANLIWVLIINFCGYKITDEIFENEKIARIVLFFEFAFLPQFFFIMFGYGIVPGMGFLMLTIYFFVRLYKSGKLIYALPMIIFAVCASLVKANYKICAMAIAIVLILKICKSKKEGIKLFIVGIVLLATTLSAIHFVEFAYCKATGIDIGKGTPISVHLAMGTDLDNDMRAPGWYDGYSSFAYPDSGYDTELCDEYAKEKLLNNIQNSIEDPARALDFYSKKVVSTWCDPLFQSVWSGPINFGGGDYSVKGIVFQSIYNDGLLEDLLCLFCKALVIIILAFALVFMITNRKKYPMSAVLFLCLVGAFFFHLISETKSQYVYMYIFMLIPLASYEINEVKEIISEKLSRR